MITCYVNYLVNYYTLYTAHFTNITIPLLHNVPLHFSISRTNMTPKHLPARCLNGDATYVITPFRDSTFFLSFSAVVFAPFRSGPCFQIYYECGGRVCVAWQKAFPSVVAATWKWRSVKWSGYEIRVAPRANYTNSVFVDATLRIRVNAPLVTSRARSRIDVLCRSQNRLMHNSRLSISARSVTTHFVLVRRTRIRQFGLICTRNETLATPPAEIRRLK